MQARVFPTDIHSIDAASACSRRATSRPDKCIMLNLDMGGHEKGENLSKCTYYLDVKVKTQILVLYCCNVILVLSISVWFSLLSCSTRNVPPTFYFVYKRFVRRNENVLMQIIVIC